MRRKVLSHFADTFCSIFVGWRFYGIPGNGPPMIERQQGILRYDVLNDVCTLDHERVPTLPVCQEIRLWFEEQLTANSVVKDELREASLTVHFRATEHLSGSKGLQVSCEGRVTTDEKDYVRTTPHATLWPIDEARR